MIATTNMIWTLNNTNNTNNTTYKIIIITCVVIIILMGCIYLSTILSIKYKKHDNICASQVESHLESCV